VLRTPGAIEGQVVIDATGRAQPPAFSVSPTQMLLTVSPLYPPEESPVAGDGRFVLRHLAGEYALAVRGLFLRAGGSSESSTMVSPWTATGSSFPPANA
jgi:hypothetical protein